MPKKIDFMKLGLREIASLDYRGDLRVQSRIRAGLVELGTTHIDGFAPPPPPPPPPPGDIGGSSSGKLTV